MAGSRKKKIEEESRENLARRIWLAGLGAYGKSVEDAQGQLDKASQEASRKFSELVSKGQSIEDQSKEALRERISEAKGKLTGARDRITEAAGSNTRSVEELLGRVREKMGLDEPVHDKLDAMSRQIGELARTVGAIAERKVRRGAGRKTGAKAAGSGAAKPSTRRAGSAARAKPASKPRAARKPR